MQIIDLNKLSRVIHPRRQRFVRVSVGQTQARPVNGNKFQAETWEVARAKTKPPAHSSSGAKQNWKTVNRSPFGPREYTTIMQLHLCLSFWCCHKIVHAIDFCNLFKIPNL
jgi:hypothetical protein